MPPLDVQVEGLKFQGPEARRLKLSSPRNPPRRTELGLNKDKPKQTERRRRDTKLRCRQSNEFSAARSAVRLKVAQDGGWGGFLGQR